MFQAREELAENQRDSDNNAVTKFRNKEKAWTQFWHQSVNITGQKSTLCTCFRRHGLNRIERELLVVLILSRLGLTEREVQDISDAIGVVRPPASKNLAAVRYLSEQGKLYKLKLISHDNPDEDIRRRNLLVDPNLVDAVLARNAHISVGWPVKNETEFYQYLGRLVRALGAISDAVNAITYGGIGDVYKRRRRVNCLVAGLYNTLQLHPTWGLNSLFNELDHDQDDQLILIALVGAELGHMSADDDLFTGAGLARCVSDNLDEVPGNLLRLSSCRLLLRSELIQPCNGVSDTLTDDSRSIEKTEFELTEKAIKLLGIDKKILKKRSGKCEVREARIGLAQLVLSDDVQQLATRK